MRQIFEGGRTGGGGGTTIADEAMTPGDDAETKVVESDDNFELADVELVDAVVSNVASSTPSQPVDTSFDATLLAEVDSFF